MTTDLSARIADREVATNKNPTVRDLLAKQRPAIEMQLAGAMNTDAFVRAVLSSINSSPQLQDADPTTLLGSVMLAAQLKLEIGPALGHFYLTPRKDHGKQICLPIIGYKGFIELAYRSGRVGKIETFLVREGDQFTHGANSERGRFFDWTPLDYEETRDWSGAIVTAHINGASNVVWAYMPRAKVLSRRPSYWESTPWKTNEEEMARKTMVREIAAYLPMSTDMGKALAADEQKVQHIQGVTELQVTREDGGHETLVSDQQLDPADPAYVEPQR